MVAALAGALDAWLDVEGRSPMLNAPAIAAQWPLGFV
jgi:hypothetical protein